MTQTTQDPRVAFLPDKMGLAVPTGRSFRRLHTLLLRLAALVTSLLVTAGLVELVVLAVLGERPKFPRRVGGAPWGLRYNEPGARYRHKSADGTWYFHINSQGMRADRDYPYEKPAGVQR